MIGYNGINRLLTIPFACYYKFWNIKQTPNYFDHHPNAQTI